jgi:histidine triad (HIT) family protein
VHVPDADQRSDPTNGVRTERNLVLTSECIFDQIVTGELPAHIVLEDDGFVGFLDYRPVFDGHTLIVPRVHYPTLAEVPAEVLGPLLEAGRRVGAAQRAALEAQGTFFALNEVVSQSVPHVHLHVVPRRFGDGLRGFLWPRHRYPTEQAAAALAARLRAALPPPGDAGH